MRDAILSVAIVALLPALSFIRLKQGAVKPEELAEQKKETIRMAIADDVE